MIKKVIAGLCLSTSLMFAQSEANININDNSLEVGFDAYMNYFYELDNSSKYYLGANYITTENELDKDARYLALNFRLENNSTYDENYGFGIGIKAVSVDDGISADFAAIALGVHGKYIINELVSVEGSYYYAPKILSFFDASRLNMAEVTLNYKIVNNAKIYIGARKIITGYDGSSSIDFDKSAFVGFKFLF